MEALGLSGARGWQGVGQQVYTEKKLLSLIEHEGNRKRIIVHNCCNKYSYKAGEWILVIVLGKRTHLDKFSFIFSCSIGVPQSDKRAREGPARRGCTAPSAAWSQWSHWWWRNVSEHRHLHRKRRYSITSRFYSRFTADANTDRWTDLSTLSPFFVENHISPSQESQTL